MKQERGQSIVELAIVLPLLILLLMGVADVGRAYYILVSLNDAASEGATYASINPSDVDGIQLRAVEATDGLMEPGRTNVSVQYPAQLVSGAPITVTAQYDMQLFTPVFEGMFPGNVVSVRGQAIQPIISVR
jgi:Flp pilus assembly protein TadG